MPKRKTLENLTFGKLTYVSELEPRKMGQRLRRFALWQCECGVQKEIAVEAVTSCSTKSCGCQIAEANRKRLLSHGMTNTVEYRAWQMIKDRCTNPKNNRWQHYGGKGVTMFVGWLNNFENFFEHMGLRPDECDSVERINPHGNYEPGNVKWDNMKNQQNNRTNNRQITFNGTTKTLAQWAEQTNIKRTTIAYRLDKLGWSVEKTLTTSTQ